MSSSVIRFVKYHVHSVNWFVSYNGTHTEWLPHKPHFSGIYIPADCLQKLQLHHQVTYQTFLCNKLKLLNGCSQNFTLPNFYSFITIILSCYCGGYYLLLQSVSWWTPSCHNVNTDAILFSRHAGAWICHLSVWHIILFRFVNSLGFIQLGNISLIVCTDSCELET
jgi:hypothetical protein